MQRTDTSMPRQIADRYVETLADLNPATGTMLGIRPGSAALANYSPEGHQALADAQRSALAELNATERATDGAGLPGVERRAARLLRERLSASLALHGAGESTRQVSNLFSPVQQLRSIFLMMPTATAEDWSVIGRRMRNLPAAAQSYRMSLEEGLARGLPAAPRQARTVVQQLGAWLTSDWFRAFTQDGPDELRAELTTAAGEATEGLAELRAYLADRYLPAVDGTPDAVGRDRYALAARQWTGSDVDLEEAYDYGWAEFHRLSAELRDAAQRVLPGASAKEAMRHLDLHGEAIEGEEEIRRWLQELMDRAIAELDGTHLDLPGPVRTVESMIAPPGSASAPYYTRPALDFSRPGRTWLPTLGEKRFPVWGLVSTWYHEGVPGHHLQLAQWAYLANELSRYQVSVGSVSATTEGWALYAERLMDELGYLTDPGHRIGYLDAQMLRAVRVIIDVGMHLELRIPAGESFHPGEVWTPALGREFLAAHSGMETAHVDSEIVRYLGMPGQAISYKLGERAWLAGRDAARTASGGRFDLKAWHMAALSLGALGLDDLGEELARLP